MRTTPRLPPRKPDRPLQSSADAGATLTPWDARGDVMVFRLPRMQSPAEAVELVRSVLELAVERGHTALLLDARAFQGVSPDMAARHEYVRGWAEVAAGRLHAAMLLEPRYIDPERFGIVVARNFGLDADVFTDEEDAVRWLREGVR